MFNLSIEKARLIQQKQEEIKQKLDQEILIHSSKSVSVKLSLLGNIIEISNAKNKSLVEIVPIINEATAKARQVFDIKQAELLQKELINLM